MGMMPKYKSPKEFREKIDAYFEDCEGKLLEDEDGKAVVVKGEAVFVGKRPPTMTGLALWMGFTSRQAFLNYKSKEKFVDAIEYARARVEEYAEGRLYDREGVSGAKFNLINNFGWSDEKTVELGERACGAAGVSAHAGMSMSEKMAALKEISEMFEENETQSES